MNQDAMTLEFPRILSQLQELAVSQAAKDALGRMEMIMDEDVCRMRMEETTAARRVLDGAGSPPLAVMEGLEDALHQAVSGAMLSAEQLTGVGRFAVSVRRLKSYLSGCAGLSAGIAAYHAELPDLEALTEEIERCVREDRVLDEASAALRTLRRKRDMTETAIREKLNHILQSRKQYLADSYVTTRGGRYVLPVQKKWQSSFGGTVVDTSAKGTTVFMEPSSVAPLRQEWENLGLEAEEEERRILYSLSDLVAGEEQAIVRGIRMMTEVDALFARAKLSQQMDARSVTIDGRRRIVIRQGRHPLLRREQCVPLDFTMDEDTAGVAITGPNTGGKTVAVKTVGLLCMMAQCGLHIPCGEGTAIGMRDRVLCDIGDSQSIEQNLSTFSGHMRNVIRILGEASRDSLVLLDELGSGTDPQEGMGIAVAVLEEFRRRGCMFLTTTHYPQVKTWAEETPGIVAARMAFNKETLTPMYRLEMGKSGESCALDIAGRLGLPPALIVKARQAAYGEADTQEAALLPTPHTRLKRSIPKAEAALPRFSMGDSVALLPDGITGIVYRPEDDKGMVIVQVKGEKRAVQAKRLKLRVPASELYPPDYDFSIIFDTVENRKAAHRMDRKFDKDAVIIHREGKP